MLLHIFLQVICRRVVFALLGRLAGKNSAAFWDTFSVDLSMGPTKNSQKWVLCAKGAPLVQNRDDENHGLCKEGNGL